MVTAPTNGAAGVIPSTLKYVTEFISQSPEREFVLSLAYFANLTDTDSIMTFLLTASGRSLILTRPFSSQCDRALCMLPT